jgi:hypothetical protein
MREHLAGRTPRLTAYFCGIALGLALLVAGMEAARVLLVGELPTTVSLGVAAVGVLGGLLLSYVAGYLNGSLVASWAGGTVPAAGRLGAPLVDGRLREIVLAVVGAAGAGVLLGTVGFVVAVEKHRHDARTADLPEPATRVELLELVAVSILVGVALAVLPLYL